MAAQEAEQQVNLPEVKISTLQVVIQGETPLLVNRFGPRAQDELVRSQTGEAKIKREARDLDAEFEDKLYRLPDGGYGYPAGAIKKAMVLAGFRFAEETGTILRGLFSIPTELIRIEGPDPERRLDPGRIARKTGHIICRPSFFPWKMTVPIRYNRTMISRDRIINILNLAGFGCGLGDWRVNCDGTFGQFRVVAAEEDQHGG